MDADEFLLSRVKWQPRIRRDKTEKLSDTVQRLMDSRISPARTKLRPVIELWNQMLSADMQKHCRIAGLKGRVLEVTTDSPSYGHELRLCSEELIREIQQNCPASKVEKIKFVIGRI
jgi:predicted nucleic acid-binding Zn ribbon protein